MIPKIAKAKLPKIPAMIQRVAHVSQSVEAFTPPISSLNME